MLNVHYMLSREIEIPVPWGFIAAKVWGDKANCIVLLVHGIFDNLESFDALVPLLPESYFYVAIDLPGHGRSSHYSKSVANHLLDQVIAIRLVIRYLKENPIILIGHSFGGKISAMYSQLYPNEVSRLIIIEGSYLNFRQVEKFKDHYKNYINQVCHTLTKISTKRAPTFTYENGFSAFISKRLHGGMAEEAAERLYKRNIVSVGAGRYQSKIDPLLRHSSCMAINASWSQDIFVKLPILCPTMYIVGKKSTIPNETREHLLKLIKLNSRGVIKIVEGGHHVLSDSPETIAPLICHFLRNKCNL
ncbi:hypothetical protein RI129_004047 [Pyrocoelia pectoralis]|uniref:AB hydrolase-1 domain-containing protein n=1 Tax=Pyrocoelia pectoralis TaxID=417401 RepID=A0AAN7VJN3_9COLE